LWSFNNNILSGDIHYETRYKNDQEWEVGKDVEAESHGYFKI